MPYSLTFATSHGALPVSHSSFQGLLAEGNRDSSIDTDESLQLFKCALIAFESLNARLFVNCFVQCKTAEERESGGGAAICIHKLFAFRARIERPQSSGTDKVINY
jgi:hypothetical protein